MDGEQAIDGADGRLPARLAVADAGHLPFVLQGGEDQLRLAVTGPAAQRAGLEERFRCLVATPMVLQGAGQAPPGHGTIRIVFHCCFE